LEEIYKSLSSLSPPMIVEIFVPKFSGYELRRPLPNTAQLTLPPIRPVKFGLQSLSFVLID